MIGSLGSDNSHESVVKWFLQFMQRKWNRKINGLQRPLADKRYAQRRFLYLGFITIFFRYSSFSGFGFLNILWSSSKKLTHYICDDF